MITTSEILKFLNKILEEDGSIKLELIKSFQKKIWSDENIEDENIEAIVTELAYDLDFYEPNQEWRKEDSSYYDDKQLREILQLAIKKIGMT